MTTILGIDDELSMIELKNTSPFKKYHFYGLSSRILGLIFLSGVFLNDGTGTSPYSTSETRDDNYKEDAV